MRATCTPADSIEAIGADLDAMLATAGRTRHLRRHLEAAAEHSVAMLAALDLPRLVTPDFVPLDPAAIGDALDGAIAALDTLDGDPDLEDQGEAEPSFGWDARPSQVHLWNGCIQGDFELDTSDGEPSLASPERHPAAPVCFSGGPYTARGGDESQLRWAEGARHDGELADEDGPIDEDELDGAGEVDAEPSIGWPEDFTADVEVTLYAGADAEHDDADREGDPGGALTWVFGPSRQGVAHV